jgi:predicted nucleic acid-binding protein
MKGGADMAHAVVDSSVTMTWFLPDERTAESQKLLDATGQHGAVVPSIWPIEVANAFLLAERRKRILVEHRVRAVETILALPIEIDSETSLQSFGPIFELASQFRLNAYDACYLELARRRELPLATLDGDLRKAAEAAGVPLLGL